MATWYRRNGWFRKGAREFTKTGFDSAKRQFNTADLDIDCSDKHFLITGANRGIGLETAVEIARKGGIVHFLCRNRASMLEARSHVITTTGNDRLHLHTLDLSRPRDVGRWARDFVTTHSRLDVLVNNAGVANDQRRLDDDGIELTFAVNTLAVHILTITLLPLLQQSAEARVINVSSAELLKVRLEAEDFSFEGMLPYDGTLAHAQTKRQQVVLSLCYAQRYEKVRFYAMHPGWVDTMTLQKSQPDLYALVKEDLRTPAQGADTVVWLAMSQAALKYPSGTFFQDRTPTATHLTLAWTRHSMAEEKQFLQNLDKHLALVSPWSRRLSDDVQTPGPAPVVAVEINPIEDHFDDQSISSLEEHCSISDSENDSGIHSSDIPPEEHTPSPAPNDYIIQPQESLEDQQPDKTCRTRNLSTIQEVSAASSLTSDAQSLSLSSVNLAEFGVTFVQENRQTSHSDIEVII